MDLMKTEYEFLDLTDVKEADRSSLQCALFRKPEHLQNSFKIAAVQASVDLSSATVSSVENPAGGECEMAPHSPARAGPPPPYGQPPPYPPPHHQWPVAPPNVYVSQVTANVNVHGYMGQYYQPPQPQYPAAAPPERARPHRRERRGKRPPSPPAHAPYYLQYPQYFPQQAQGAPLYHMPVYQPLVYGPYPYPPYYHEYPVPVEGEPDKPPDEYPPEAVMEQEAVEAYYAGAHYAPPYPPAEQPVEYLPPAYLPPPTHYHPAPPHQPHHLNVHAKNFVAGQGKPRDPPAAPVVSAAATVVDSLPFRDLKIAARRPASPKRVERPPDVPPIEPNPPDVPPTAPRPEPSEPAWSPPAGTEPELTAVPPQPTKPFIPAVNAAPVPAPALTKPTAPAGKPSKGPAAPFSGGKQPAKPLPPPTAVPAQPAASAPKAPFGNRQKREGPAHRSPPGEAGAADERAAEHARREPPLPPSKAPMPISITLPTAGQPLIVTNKPPFHSRKPALPEPPAAPQPPPPAPTASDFPPPPTPRNRGEPPPAPAAPQPQPAPGKSWASLFSSKAPAAAAEEPVPAGPAPPPAGLQKPVAKVQPYDASPLPTADKGSPTPRPAAVPAPVPPPPVAAPTISYSEKTSVNAVSATSAPAPKPAVQPAADAVLAVKEGSAPPLPQPSPFSDDPNSYRMGEFLSKYQLDNRPVSLLPRGLTNRSNYCYVNAILQALIACPPFYNMLKALPYQTRRGNSSTPVIDSMVELCYEFSPLSTAGRNARGAAAAPAVPAGPPLENGAGLRVLRALRPFPGSQEGRQEDAEEFLGCLLNSLNDEMLELIKLVEPEDPKDTNGQVNGVITQEPQEEFEDDSDEWKVMGPKNRGAVERRWAARRTPVADIFRGKTRVRLHRSTHHDVTDAVQPFFTLQLDIERASSVKDALELLAGRDALEGVNDAWQQLSIEQLPVVLLLHLKCFQLDSEGHTAKIVKNIDFPIDLKIDPKVMSTKLKYTTKQRVYKLFAVVYHEGVEAVKGHYLTDTYHGQVGWIRYDDSTVTQVTDAQVLKAKPPRMPYLLMYRRHDTLPPHRSGKLE